MRSGSGYLRTDEYLDAAESLRAAAQFADEARNRAGAWKWLLIAVHSSAQAAFVLALSRGSFLLALKHSHAKAWLRAHEGTGSWPAEIHLDYFLELYVKTKQHVVARPPSGVLFSCTPVHDTAMERLNFFRNGLIHFVPQGWSIELAGLPQIISSCVEVARYIMWDSGAVIWPSASLSTRARGSANHLVRALSRLSAR